MAQTRRIKTPYDYTLKGTGVAADDTAQLKLIRDAINARGNGHVIVTGNVALDEVVDFSPADGLRMQFVDNGKMTFHSGGKLTVGGDSTYFGSGVAINAANTNQEYFELAVADSLDLKTGDYVLLWADNEYSSPYSQRLATIEARPAEVHRIVGTTSGNANQFQINGFLSDDLTTNPNVSKLPMIKNVVIENPVWQDASTRDIVDGKTFVDVYDTLSSAPSGSSTDDFILVEDDRTIYFWNGSSWVAQIALNRQSVAFNRTAGLELINRRSYTPCAGEVLWRNFYAPSIQNEFVEDKPIAQAAVETDIIGYVHVVRTGSSMRLTGEYGLSRHVWTSGGEARNSHFYGGPQDCYIDVTAKVRNGYAHPVRGLIDFHSEGIRNTVKAKATITNGGQNSQVVTSEARQTRMAYSEVKGQGVSGGGIARTAAAGFFAPDCEFDHNFVSGVGRGVEFMDDGLAYFSQGGGKCVHNTFKRINGAACVSDGGDNHEFSFNHCDDVSYDSTFGSFYGEEQAIVWLGEGSGHRAVGNVMPKQNNVYAFDMGTSTLSGDRIENNVCTGYAQDEVFRVAGRANGTTYRDAFLPDNAVSRRVKRVVDTVADMMALSNVADGEIVETKRYSMNHVAGDGSGNTFVYEASNADTPDGGFTMPGLGGSLSFTGSGGTFDGVSGTGRFAALNQDVASIAKFGGLAGDQAENNTAIPNALSSAKSSSVPVVVEDAYTANAWTTHVLGTGNSLRIIGTTEVSAINLNNVTSQVFIEHQGDNLVLENIALDGWTSATQLNSTSIVKTHIRNCTLSNMDAAVNDFGNGTGECETFIVEGCKISTMNERGIQYRAINVGDVAIRNNIIAGITASNSSPRVIMVGADDETSTSKSVIIEGNVIRNVTEDTTNCYGILALCPRVIIRNNFLSDVSVSGTAGDCYGIYTKSMYAIVDGNVLLNAGHGGSTENRGINCKGEVKDAGTPTSPFGYGVRIIANTVVYDGTATIDGTHASIESWRVEAMVYGNRTERGNHGILVLGDDTEVSNNKIVNCVQFGVYVFGASRVSCYANTFADNPDGFQPYEVRTGGVSEIDGVIIDGGYGLHNGTASEDFIVLNATNSGDVIKNVCVDNVDATGWSSLIRPTGSGAANITPVLIKSGCVHDGTYFSGVNSGMIVSGVSGMGSPNTVVISAPGGTFSRSDGGAGTSWYVKEANLNANGWVGK